jgi:outer membrane protein OmpA-like peptidoglycan-associated protein
MQRPAIKPSFSPVPAPMLQRKCACGGTPGPSGECAACKKKREASQGMVQRSASSTGPVNEVPSIVHDVLRSPGQPLETGTRTFMESRFGEDFSGVRVHTDSRAAESARAVNALAYTVGRNVVFDSGRYAPQTQEGQKLMAHELTHVVQQSFYGNGIPQRLSIGAPEDASEQEASNTALAIGQHEMGDKLSTQLAMSPQIQRSRSSRTQSDCPNYQENEVQTSHTEAGHLTSDVSFQPGKLIVADFGVDWRHVKSSTARDPLLTTWLARFEADPSYRLNIVGFSDCVGREGTNTTLRQARARNIEALLGPNARSRVTFRGMSALGTYVGENDTPENRAQNRSVVIEFNQQIEFEQEEIVATRKACGPDVTQWLVSEMNKNMNHPVIRNMREIRWPRYVPGLNIGWTAGALDDFKDLVKSGGPWDFKSHQGKRQVGEWRASPGKSCPTNNCDKTVTLCGTCVNYDVPGNIHYGWVGSAANLRSWFLHFAAGLVQPNQWTDDPKDAVAVEIGEAMWDSGADMCSQVVARRNQLNLEKTEGCGNCPG